MAEEEASAPLNPNPDGEGTDRNQAKIQNMIHPQDGMRYRGEARSHDGHQVTRYFISGLIRYFNYVVDFN